MESKIINNKIELTRRDDQIYVYKALNKCQLDIETAEAMTKVGDDWSGTALCANLVDIRDMFFVDSKVRNYAADQYREHVAGSRYFSRLPVYCYICQPVFKVQQTPGSHKTIHQRERGR
ncbi:MAG: hypothetical protein PF489_01070 [Salinivirgaceae bacterium]|jgi:hypothetical protein|nr:hypothetical protein [Salinivirgaceae bacterium]